ncbi:MAG: type I 3-dehydroquinate dehydratase [Thermoproteota archaeon]|nr:type I 3-dehydroquinate dehydratase [Thermoproteota archaeon]
MSASVQRKVCVAIPIIEKEIEILGEKIKQCLEIGADLIEFRFDYLENIDSLDLVIDKVLPYKKNSIFTLRKPEEGGKYRGTESDRIALLMKLASLEPQFTDIEYSSIIQNDELADFIDQGKSRILVSWHDFARTPSNDTLVGLINDMRIYSNYIKIVTTANTIDDSIRMLELYSLVDSRINLVTFSMGELGIISRVLCTVIGDSPFTYASMEKGTVAAGQLSINQMTKIYSLFKRKIL